jgi:hypothetical protein
MNVVHSLSPPEFKDRKFNLKVILHTSSQNSHVMDLRSRREDRTEVETRGLRHANVIAQLLPRAQSRTWILGVINPSCLLELSHLGLTLLSGLELCPSEFISHLRFDTPWS